jgi:formate hydrogenlyase subunit 3/multisubunit Na+/H+ antiporter MnhD subunit
MARRRWYGLAAFVAWTFFIWLNRLANAWSSETESTADKVVSSLLAALFLAFAVYGVVVLVTTWRRPLTDAAARVLQAFVVTTAVVWVLRIVQISLGDREVGFKVVHAALGVVAIALGVGVWRTAVAALAGDRRARVDAGA